MRERGGRGGGEERIEFKGGKPRGERPKIDEEEIGEKTGKGEEGDRYRWRLKLRKHQREEKEGRRWRDRQTDGEMK